MKQYTSNPIAILVFIVVILLILSIIGYNYWGWFGGKKVSSYTLYTVNDSFPHYICYNDDKGLNNCTAINIPTNQYTENGSIGPLTYKADVNATRDMVTITLFDRDNHILDKKTVRYN